MNNQNKILDVSVVIPVYNTGKILLETIDSVLNQTFIEFEIILVNDGSTDETTLNILNTISDSRIKVIHQVNSGVAIARNQGIKEAKGNYIAFLDHDDLFGKNKLKKLYDIISSSSNIVIAYSGISSFGEKINRFCNLKPVVGNKLLKFLERNWIYSTSCIIINKKIIETHQIQFDRECVPCDDWDFYIQCAIHGDIVGIEDILTFYRVHSNNQSSNQIKMYLAGIKVSRKYLEKINSDLLGLNVSKLRLKVALFKSLSTLHYGLSLQYAIEKNLLQFIFCFIKGFLYNPFSPKIFLFLIKRIAGIFHC